MLVFQSPYNHSCKLYFIIKAYENARNFVFNGHILIQHGNITFKVRSYYTTIALRCRYIDYFLLQVTAASPHFKLKSIKSQFLCKTLQCSNTTQLRCSMNWPLMTTLVIFSSAFRDFDNKILTYCLFRLHEFMQLCWIWQPNLKFICGNLIINSGMFSFCTFIYVAKSGNVA